MHARLILHEIVRLQLCVRYQCRWDGDLFPWEIPSPRNIEKGTQGFLVSLMSQQCMQTCSRRRSVGSQIPPIHKGDTLEAQESAGLSSCCLKGFPCSASLGLK